MFGNSTQPCHPQMTFFFEQEFGSDILHLFLNLCSEIRLQSQEIQLQYRGGQSGPVLVCEPPSPPPPPSPPGLKDSGPGGDRTMWGFAFCLLLAPFCCLLHFQRMLHAW